MILPVAKLGTLLLKTMSKPIATRLKTEASRHPKFRQLIISLAQANHRISTNIQRRVYGHATNVEIRPLNEEKAVQAAADLIGELFVFSAIRQKEDQLAEEILTMKQKLSELERLANSRGLSGLFRSSSVPDQIKPT
ncbi:OPA3-like protein isoform X2 [Panicum virgatum]|uniref:OPA3-like protein n=1 Tax=Panicum virgatum TaxID=38727 RepID=A0A8T0QZB4_PANVG|nr:OPA3-like protein isoform X2 [Panicum virgatum]KAG2578246.1 hypothetical protein PVAP13_6NG200400 [Panicum virgatum]KAG2578249.1 hypothetical protein PVAP13_6NG200400 [Panicum virgatum]KAG2578250.1 hypothetical protein PVAP13_6NG200400 [Panicum virgatum]